jgi:hypothetical protein
MFGQATILAIFAAVASAQHAPVGTPVGNPITRPLNEVSFFAPHCHHHKTPVVAETTGMCVCVCVRKNINNQN